MENYNQLTQFEKDFLLNLFMHQMPWEQRRKIMQEHPALYNKLVQQEVMVIKHNSEAQNG